MSWSLTVEADLEALAERLGDRLAEPLPDPFTREVITVPGDGVRTWLSARLAERLGIVANIEFTFPTRLVQRATGAVADEWAIGPLTWAVHEVMHLAGAELGLQPDAVRARRIADLFDKYATHRAGMLREWEAGCDVDAFGVPVPAHLRWQPQLWRLVREVVGLPSPATSIQRAIDDLAAGRLDVDLPPRLFLVGLTSLPPAHLDVLGALAQHREVEVFAPAPSLDLWRRLVPTVTAGLPRPCLRERDPSASATRHRLLASWGRSAREAHVLLLDAARRVGVEPVVAAPGADVAGLSPDLLTHLQQALLRDVDPGEHTAGAFDFRHPLAADDRSVQLHRCHGIGRQVEVLRDVLAHLLEQPATAGRPALEPRDIVVLCPDVATVAPLAEAVFAGGGGGVPELPLRVADRSLRQDNPVLDAVDALLGLADGRFRASDVLAFVARPPVRRRFGLAPDRVGRLAEWVGAVNIHWGLDTDGRDAFGVPQDITAHTWRAGLDQLLLGSVMADTGMRIGPGGTVPFGDIEGDDVELAGTLAEVIDRLAAAVDRVAVDQSVATWCDAVRVAALSLCAVADVDSWQWGDLETELGQMADESVPAGQLLPRDVPWRELATLLRERLVGRPGRPRFGTGAITLSSLTAQRGVPARVVCVLGLDGDVGVASTIGSDDLMLAAPCVGDRDPHGEMRAQLLDALLAAGNHFIVCSSGRDVRSNAHVPAAVPLAELADLIDASAVPVDLEDGTRRATDQIAVDHPRQAWSEPNFLPGALGFDAPLSFDEDARTAALHRRVQRRTDDPDGLPAEERTDVRLDDLIAALINPVQVFLRRRLGIEVEHAVDGYPDTIPLEVRELDKWKLREQLVQLRLAAGPSWSPELVARWTESQAAAGAVPPKEFGRLAVDQAVEFVDQLMTLARSHVGDALDLTPTDVPIDIELPDGRRIIGTVPGARGNVALDVTPSRMSPDHRMRVWMRAAALASARPQDSWRVVHVGRESQKAAALHMSIRSAEHARRVLVLADHLYWSARRGAFPGAARLTSELRTSRDAAAKVWEDQGPVPGLVSDPWVRFVFGGATFDDVMAMAPVDEHDASWGTGVSRLERWAHRVWSEFDTSTRFHDRPAGADGDAADGADGGRGQT